ncbi:MAG: HIT family protein [Bacteroidetes bacterium]|nr:HIT family protein [Bacteroidota bacterium]
MASIFSKIIAGEIPSYRIAENELFYCFLDVFPLVHGHTLVVPKREVDKLYELNQDELSAMLVFAQPIAQAIEKAFPCKRCGFSVVGLEVPHAHLHIVPIDSAGDLNFTRPKLKPTAEELADAQQRILQHLTA